MAPRGFKARRVLILEHPSLFLPSPADKGHVDSYLATRGVSVNLHFDFIFVSCFVTWLLYRRELTSDVRVGFLGCSITDTTDCSAPPGNFFFLLLFPLYKYPRLSIEAMPGETTPHGQDRGRLMIPVTRQEAQPASACAWDGAGRSRVSQETAPNKQQWPH